MEWPPAAWPRCSPPAAQGLQTANNYNAEQCCADQQELKKRLTQQSPQPHPPPNPIALQYSNWGATNPAQSDLPTTSTERLIGQKSLGIVPTRAFTNLVVADGLADELTASGLSHWFCFFNRAKALLRRHPLRARCLFLGERARAWGKRLRSPRSGRIEKRSELA
jgi:hypothetical protein